MHPNPDPYEEIQKLLSLKRYEQPPPRYFNHLSSDILNRLGSGDQGRSGTWWQRVREDWDLQPAFLCGLGVIVCGLLSAGMITSMRKDVAPTREIWETATLPPVYLGTPESGSPPSSVWQPVPPSTDPILRVAHPATMVPVTYDPFGN